MHGTDHSATSMVDETTRLLDRVEADLRSLWLQALADPLHTSLADVTEASRAVQRALSHLEHMEHVDADELDAEGFERDQLEPGVPVTS